jgi:hypothetical protein
MGVTPIVLDISHFLAVASVSHGVSMRWLSLSVMLQPIG